MVTSHFATWKEVTTDNFCTSISLAEQLVEKQTDIGRNAAPE